MAHERTSRSYPRPTKQARARYRQVSCGLRGLGQILHLKGSEQSENLHLEWPMSFYLDTTIEQIVSTVDLLWSILLKWQSGMTNLPKQINNKRVKNQ